MNFAKKMEQMKKNLKWYDMGLIKTAVFFFTLFLVAVWSGFRNLVMGIHWGWYLGISLALMIIVYSKTCCK